MSSITNSTEDSNSNSSNTVERRQPNSQISVKNQKLNLLPDCNVNVNTQEEWCFESNNDEKKLQEQDCKKITLSTSSKQQDSDYSATANNTYTREKETLSIQGKITNSSNAEGLFSPLDLIFYHLSS